MPRFYVHMFRDGVRFDDIEGAEFDDFDAALAEAEEAGREIISELVIKCDRIGGKTLEIHDERGERLTAIPLLSLVHL